MQTPPLVPCLSVQRPSPPPHACPRSLVSLGGWLARRCCVGRLVRSRCRDCAGSRAEWQQFAAMLDAACGCVRMVSCAESSTRLFSPSPPCSRPTGLCCGTSIHAPARAVDIPAQVCLLLILLLLHSLLSPPSTLITPLSYSDPSDWICDRRSDHVLQSILTA